MKDIQSVIMNKLVDMIFIQARVFHAFGNKRFWTSSHMRDFCCYIWWAVRGQCVRGQKGNATDNPTINSSIVRYDSKYSHKPRGTSKPTFSSQKGYLPSITSISKI